MSAPLWTPPPERMAASRLAAFVRRLAAGELGPPPPAADLASFEALHAWSVRDPAAFWSAVWRAADVMADGPHPPLVPDAVVRGLDRMAPPDPERGPRWFPEARLNFAEHLLRRRDAEVAIVAWGEGGHVATVTFAELAARVARCRAALRAEGVGVGDRVAGFMPNVPETVVAMLATSSLGAVWTSCSPDFGVQGVLDRFGQIEPTVLVAAAGYRYAGKRIGLAARVSAVVAGLPTVRRVVVVTAPGDEAGDATAGIAGAVPWDRWLADAPDEALAFERLPFDHPLHVMYSSGTTGLPKCMVHGAGGTLLQHWKELALHTDVGAGDRLFYFTTCGWMMWNWLVSGLAVGATVVLYDGAPLAEPGILWDMAAAEGVTVFGTSAKYLALAQKAGVRPAATHDLGQLRTILSTGSPLAPHSYDYVYRDVKRDVCLSSISGGTDIISCFALGNPFAPVHRGELQGRGLGMAVEVFDADGRAVVGQAGELVCTRPFPSMPVAFWNDPDGAKYRAAYFEQIPGVWRHGDWAELTGRGGLVIHGRSDATLNPGGVRVGTAEIYRVVETLDEVVESLVVGQDVPDGDGGRDVRVVLFVRLREGAVLDDALRERIRRRVREGASPHHVPRAIAAVPDIPRTVSGKITELAVREVIHGRPVRNIEALANPEALAHFRDREELRTA